MSRRIIEQDSPTVSPRPYAKRAAPPEIEIKALTKFEREKLKDSKRELQGLPPEKRPVRSPAKTKESKRRVLPSETLSKLKMEAKALAEAEAKANPIPKAPTQEILEPAKQAPKVLWQPNSQVQIDFLSAWEDEVLFSGGRGPLAYGELVLTSEGFKPIEDVNIGDYVRCPDNTLARVVDIPYDGSDECYEFTFVDGRKSISSVTHRWPVFVKGKQGESMMTTQQIATYYRDKIETKEGYGKNYVSIPLAAAVELSEAGDSELPIDPYLLGLLLGDGSWPAKGTIKVTTDDPEIVASVAELYPNGSTLSSNDICFLQPAKLKRDLADLDLLDTKSLTKFVPEVYKNASVQQRLALVQGLMDTDGTMDKHGNPSFCSTSIQLAKDVQWLVWSLGGKATITSKEPFYKAKDGSRVYCNTAYTLYIQLPDTASLFRLTRKRERASLKIGDSTTNSRVRLSKVESVGVKNCKCITIDHPEHKFLTSCFITTYNSGKSDCLLIDPLRWVDNRNFRGLIIRRTMPELRELIDRSKRFYLDFAPGCKWKDQDKLFVFPSGAKIEFGYCETSEDVERYRGQQYTWLGIDEITQFSDDTMLDKLKASLRTSDPNLPIYIRATTNPSGAGCRWVKQRWVDEGPANSTIRKHYTIRGYNGVPDENYVITRRWFNSVPDDNKALSKAYKASLVAIDNDILRRQWLYGEWISEGLAFDEFKVANHVVVPFKLPHNWYKFRACDWGYSSMAVCLWFAVDYDGNIFVYRELKTKGVTADKFAEMVLELEQADNVHYGILDASVWSQRGQVGDTPADTMISMGCYWTPSDSSKGSRVAGKNLIHQYLALDPETNEPRVKIFNTCHELIKEMTSLPLDAHNPEDVDTKACDHAYDAFRYGLSSRPRITSQYYDEFSQGVPIGRNTEVVVDDFFGY